ncbi:MAG: diacylglycerol kinase family lipid kinase [Clostridiales bacterium]|nr:diacylglycerol kinase family lipid kinase [Clostridiales bacterium]
MRCKVICNPYSGRHATGKKLERILGKLVMKHDMSLVDIHRTTGIGDAWRVAAALSADEYDFVIGAGGDGTMNEIVNGLVESGSKLPLAILPGGTANDFAVFMNLPTEVDDFCLMLNHGKVREVDLGWANGRYFINVAAFGMFTDVPYKTRNRDKSILGKLAYYMQGLSDAPEQLFSTMQLQAVCGGESMQTEAFLCIIANSGCVGGVRLFNKAEVDDGLLDMLLVAKPLRQTLAETLQTLFSSEDQRRGIIWQMQLGEASFSSLEDKTVDLDLDGEKYGSLPLNIKVAPKALKLFVPDFQPRQQQRLEIKSASHSKEL